MESANTLIYKIIENLWKEAQKGNTKIAFFNVSSDKNIADTIHSVFEDKLSDLRLYRYSLQNNSANPPFFPYLEVIKDYIAAHSISDVSKFVSESGIYFFQQPVFTSYLKGLPTKRYEEVLFEELEFEKTQFLHSINKLLSRLVDREPLVILIENLHFAPHSTIELVRYLMEKVSDKSVLFLFSLDTHYSHISDNRTNHWSDFIDFIESKGLLLDFSKATYSLNPSYTERENINSLDDLLQMIMLSKDCFNFLNLQECKEYILQAYNYKVSHNVKLPAHYYSIMLYLLGDVHTFLEDYDSALIYYNSLLSFVQHINNLKGVADVFRKIGFIYLRKDDIDTAQRLGNQSLKIAMQINDDLQIFHAYFLLFLTEDKGRSASLAHWRETYEVIIDLARDLKMINTLAYYCTNPYGLYSQYTRDNEILHNYGIKLAEKYSNKYRLATAYQTKGLVNSVQGNYAEVLKYYTKSKDIKEELGNKLELSYSYNGLGFYYYLTGNYPQAELHYEKALECLKLVRNYHEIAMTFYNVACNYFFAFKNDLAIPYLNKLLSLMNVLKLGGLKYHSLHGIYSLIGVIYACSGDISKAYEYLTRIKLQKLHPYPEKNEEYFLFELLQALILSSENKFDEAETFFRKALVYLNKKNDVIIYMVPRFYYEFGMMFRKTNREDKALEAFQGGLSICDQLNYAYYKDLLLNMINNKNYSVKPAVLTGKTFDFDWTIEAAKLEMNLTKLHKKISEINFLNNLQSILTKTAEKQSLINNTMDFINTNFFVDVSALYLKEDNRLQCKYIINKYESFNLNALLDVLKRDSVEKIVLRAGQEPDYQQFSMYLNSIIYIPLISKGETIGSLILINRDDDIFFSYSDLQILSIACKQLITALEKIDNEMEIVRKNKELHEANESLLKAVTTDSLTGVNNRQALHKKLEELRRKIILNAQSDTTFMVMFIDLDNFKLYNDAFGHQVGDIILIKFAEILTSIARDKDFVARYGGDEFVVVCENKSMPEAAILSSKIQDAVISCGRFQQDIENYLNKKVYIADKDKLSCSIGITQYDKNKDTTIDLLIRQADNAMYRAKHSGKNQFMIWTEAAFSDEENGSD